MSRAYISHFVIAMAVDDMASPSILLIEFALGNPDNTQ